MRSEGGGALGAPGRGSLAVVHHSSSGTQRGTSPSGDREGG